MTPYGIHPSSELVELFARRPYQGQAPDKASIVILGNDANYSPQISNHTFFSRILEYHEDGVRFWKTNKAGVHHPFLLPTYPFDKTKDGVPYHRNFAKLGLTSEHAERVSFVELLNVPTTGSTGSDKEYFFELLDEDYLLSLEHSLLHGKDKIVLLNRTFLRTMSAINRKFDCFDCFVNELSDAQIGESVRVSAACTCYIGYSFSAYQFHGSIPSIQQALWPYLDSDDPDVYDQEEEASETDETSPEMESVTQSTIPPATSPDPVQTVEKGMGKLRTMLQHVLSAIKNRF